MSRHLEYTFHLMGPDTLRGMLSEPGVRLIAIDEVDLRKDEPWWVFLGAFDLVGGEKVLTVETGYPFEAGRATSPKSLIKRAVRAAQEVHEHERPVAHDRS